MTHINESLLAFLPSSLLHWIRFSSICNTSHFKSCGCILSYIGVSHYWLQRMTQCAISVLGSTSPNRNQSFSCLFRVSSMINFWYMICATRDGVEIEGGKNRGRNRCFYKDLCLFWLFLPPQYSHFTIWRTSCFTFSFARIYSTPVRMISFPMTFKLPPHFGQKSSGFSMKRCLYNVVNPDTLFFDQLIFLIKFNCLPFNNPLFFH